MVIFVVYLLEWSNDKTNIAKVCVKYKKGRRDFGKDKEPTTDIDIFTSLMSC